MISSRPIGSIAIPAHNEAAVIRNSLDTLLHDAPAGEIEVVVVCNGCNDSTADIVRSSPYDVRVIEIAQASKAAALRAADEVLTIFPRLYIDADVLVPSKSARRILERLNSGPALAARPPFRYDTAGASPLVRSYYRARVRVPANMNSLWGGGLYGVSEVGRARFGAFPDLIADDLFVAQHFHPAEIEIVNSAPVTVKVPRRNIDLWRILRRAYHGNFENQKCVDSPASTTSFTLQTLAVSLRANPGTALDALTYAGFTVAARVTLKIAPPRKWERDESSRS